MSRQDFIDQLKALRYEPQELPEGRIAFDYTVPLGRFVGQQIRLGFSVGDDFPMNPPSGPHISPHLLPLKNGGVHPYGQVLPSPFGPEWQYWSRPFPGWAGTDRTVRTYLAHIRHLLETQ